MTDVARTHSVTPATLESRSPTQAMPPASIGCCGGPAPAGTDGCCALDAEVKSAGDDGCGCATTAAAPAVPKASCCD
jgi:hypothetical protein